MARITIKGRKDPIEISRERAVAVKNRWLGLNDQAKADPHDVFDLGDWAGEYGRIAEIDLDEPLAKLPQRVEIDEAAEEKKQADAWALLTVDQKADQLAYFVFAYKSRSGLFGVDPPQEVMDKARKIQAKYFKANPTQRRVPVAEFDTILPPKVRGISLLDRKSMERIPNGRICKVCGKPLVDQQDEYCSGECLMNDESGEIATA